MPPHEGCHGFWASLNWVALFRQPYPALHERWRCFRSRTLLLVRLLSSSVGLPVTTLSTRPYGSITLVFTLERAFNLDTRKICIWTLSTSSRAGKCDVLEGLSTLSTAESASSSTKTVGSA